MAQYPLTYPRHLCVGNAGRARDIQHLVVVIARFLQGVGLAAMVGRLVVYQPPDGARLDAVGL